MWTSRTRWQSSRASSTTLRAIGTALDQRLAGEISTLRTAARQRPIPSQPLVPLTNCPPATCMTLRRPGPSWRGLPLSNATSTRCSISSSSPTQVKCHECRIVNEYSAKPVAPTWELTAFHNDTCYRPLTISSSTTIVIAFNEGERNPNLDLRGFHGVDGIPVTWSL